MSTIRLRIEIDWTMGGQFGLMALLDIVRTRVVTHAPDDSVVAAVDSMREEAVSCVVIVDDGRPTGIVSDRAIALQIGGDRDPADLALRDVPAGDVDPVDADIGVYELLEHMANRGVRRVPVVDDGGLAGIVSISDLVILLGMELQHVANVLRTDAPAYERSPSDLYE